MIGGDDLKVASRQLALLAEKIGEHDDGDRSVGRAVRRLALDRDVDGRNSTNIFQKAGEVVSLILNNGSIDDEGNDQY